MCVCLCVCVCFFFFFFFFCFFVVFLFDFGFCFLLLLFLFLLFIVFFFFCRYVIGSAHMILIYYDKKVLGSNVRERTFGHVYPAFGQSEQNSPCMHFDRQRCKLSSYGH